MIRPRALRYVALMIAMLVVAVTLVLAADRHNRIADVSASGRNSLRPETSAVLGVLNETVEVFAIVPRAAEVVPALEAFFSRYARAHPDFQFRIVDPAEDLEFARELGAGLGEILVRYREHEEQLTTLDDATMTNALARLARGETRFLTVLNAHGERRVGRRANHDLSALAESLDARGLGLREFALDRQTGLPDNTAVLVIASPRVGYSLGELDRLRDYIETGGNLLWLSEPERPPGLGMLADMLGVRQLAGTIVDPRGLTALEDGNPAFTVGQPDADHPALGEFDSVIVLPYAAALEIKAGSAWQSRVLARSGPAAWTEIGPLDGQVAHDGDDEVQGALALAVALTRSRADGREQRVVVIGDGDFASNTFIDGLGNREFVRRLIDWLAEDEDLVPVSMDAVPDATLELAMWQRLVLFAGFGILLPLAFLGNGLWLYWRRRRA